MSTQFNPFTGKLDYTANPSGEAPASASYITLGTDATLTNERVLTAGANITLTDGGAGGTLTIAASGGGVTGGYNNFTVATKTANYTLTSSDEVILADATTAGFTLTLPAATSGLTFFIKKIDSSANTVTIDADASQTIDGGLTATLTTQYEAVTLVSDGTNWFIF